MIVTAELAATPLVLMVKLALVWLAGTVTLAGTAATTELLLERLIGAPSEPATPSKVTVPCDGFPPTTFGGFTLSVESRTGTTVNAAL